MKEYRVIIDDNRVQFLKAVRQSLTEGWRFENKRLTMGRVSKQVMRKRGMGCSVTLVRSKQ